MPSISAALAAAVAHHRGGDLRQAEPLYRQVLAVDPGQRPEGRSPGGVRMARPNGDHATMVPSGRWKEAVQAYLATIAYCDAQIGRLLDAPDNVPSQQPLAAHRALASHPLRRRRRRRRTS